MYPCRKWERLKARPLKWGWNFNVVQGRVRRDREWNEGDILLSFLRRHVYNFQHIHFVYVLQMNIFYPNFKSPFQIFLLANKSQYNSCTVSLKKLSSCTASGTEFCRANLTEKLSHEMSLNDLPIPLLKHVKF